MQKTFGKKMLVSVVTAFVSDIERPVSHSKYL